MKKHYLLILPVVLSSLILLSSCTPNEELMTTEEEPLTTEAQTTAQITESPTLETTEIETTEFSIYDNAFEPKAYDYARAFPNLTFEQPLLLTHREDLIYVVEKTGKIKRFQNDDNVSEFEVFVDLSNRIDSSASEKGLLGFAFHPNFEENGLYFVYYTNRQGSVIAKHSIEQEEEILLTFQQPYANHNGGHIEFGPDGYLYIASGDGGSSGDPQNYSQNKASLLGKILRIDVDTSTQDKPYDIPSDNPFVGNTEGYMEEIFAFGLRNPWRFNFDEERDLLIAADVGQNKVEEINIIVNGGNYGWNFYEGTHDYKPGNVDQSTLIMPIWEYEHPIGKSITGGYTYYGENVPSLYGTYIYGDFMTGIVWGLWINQDTTVQNIELFKSPLKISSFGVDSKGEVYIIDYSGGIYRINEIE